VILNSGPKSILPYHQLLATVPLILGPNREETSDIEREMIAGGGCYCCDDYEKKKGKMMTLR